MTKRFAVRVYKASHYVDITVKCDNEGQAHSIATDLARSPKVKMHPDKEKEGTLIAVTLEEEPVKIKMDSSKTH